MLFQEVIIISAKTNSCLGACTCAYSRRCICITLPKIIILRLIFGNSSLRGLAPPEHGPALACFARDEMQLFLILVLGSGSRSSIRVGGNISGSSDTIISCGGGGGGGGGGGCSGICIFLRSSGKRRR